MDVGINDREKLAENETSIEFLFKSCYARLCLYASRLNGDRKNAEDLVQGVFLNCLHKKVHFQNETQAKAYLYHAVKNACLNAVRHQLVIEKSAQKHPKIPENEANMLENLIKSEVFGEIHAAIEALPVGCKQVLKLAFFDSLKNEEIARLLGISVNTVKTQKARALSLLRLKLDPKHFLLLLVSFNSWLYAK